MNQKIINKIWINALAILMTFSFGLICQAEAKSRSVEANAKASKYIGVAPLQVQFSAENSVTDEGTIRICKWKADGIGVQKGMIVNYTFNEPGNYAVNLLVKNSLGDFDKDTVNIEVCPRTIHVDDMSISLISGIGDSIKAKVVVTITDDQGEPVADVMVRGRWRGLVKGNATGISCAKGKVAFVSDSTSNEGAIKFRVKNAGVAGCRFIQAKNLIKIRPLTRTSQRPFNNNSKRTTTQAYASSPFSPPSAFHLHTT